MIKFVAWQQNWSRDLEAINDFMKPKREQRLGKDERKERVFQAAARAFGNLDMAAGAIMVISAIPVVSPLLLITGLFVMAMGHEMYAIGSRVTNNYMDSLSCFYTAQTTLKSAPPPREARGARGFIGKIVQEVGNTVDAVGHAVEETAKAAAKGITTLGFTEMTEALFVDTLGKTMWLKTARFAIGKFVELNASN